MRVMVAVDGSADSRRALDRAIELCKTGGVREDEIILLSIAEEILAFTAGPYVDHSYVAKANIRITEHTTNLLKKYGHVCKENNVKVKALLGKGNPKEVIAQEVEDNGVDLLLIGRRGMGRFERLLVGSNSQYCVQNCPCAVWIVKCPQDKVQPGTELMADKEVDE